MKKILFSPFLLLFGVCSGQVGIGTINPRGALDINKSTTNEFGLVLPTNSSTDNIVNPQGGSVVVGTIMYDSTDDCLKVFKLKGWSNCICDLADSGSKKAGTAGKRVPVKNK